MFAECFAQLGVREPQPRASLAFTQFADYHRLIEKKGVDMVKQLKPVSLVVDLFAFESDFDLLGLLFLSICCIRCCQIWERICTRRFLTQS
jgi:hypothetical protein